MTKANKVNYSARVGTTRTTGPVPTAFAALLVLAATVAFSSQAARAESCWTVLRYDKQGKVISQTQCGEKPEEVAPESDQDQPIRKEIEPGQVLLLDPPVGTETRLRQMGYRVLEKMEMHRFDVRVWVVQTPQNIKMNEALKTLHQAFPGLTIDTNDLMDLSASGGTTAQATTLPYDRETVGWGEVPATCGRGLKIGMIDGAVDTDHRALKGQKLVYRSFIKDGRREAAYDHGTAVAIMLVGRPGVDGQPGGLLPGARLYAANIFEVRGGGKKGNLAALLRAVDWMAENRVPLVNMSVAGSYNKVMEIVLNRMAENGMIAVAAAGNNGPGAHPAWPAAHDNVFAVTAIDRRRSVYRFANQGDYIDFAAPGVDIRTQTPGGPRDQSGTSFATPYVTGMVAIHLMSGFPPDVPRIRKSLQRYSNDLGQSGRDKVFGWGLIRLRPSCK